MDCIGHGVANNWTWLSDFHSLNFANTYPSNRGFPDSSVGKESSCNAGVPCLLPGWRRPTGDGIGYSLQYSWAFLLAQLVKNLPAMREIWVWSLGWVGKISWRRERLPTPAFWPGEFHGLYSLWGRNEWDTTEQLSVSHPSNIYIYKYI